MRVWMRMMVRVRVGVRGEHRLGKAELQMSSTELVVAAAGHWK